MKPKNTILIVFFVLLFGFLLLFIPKHGKNIFTDTMPVFSKNTMLQSLWFHYKVDYLEKDSLRSLDKQRGDITTSEGQSYTMLRAVWMNDKKTFDTVWQFTKDNLQHKKDDHLISWLFGKRADGSYGVMITDGGNNTATDADVDIALALLFASKRWNDDSYKYDALPIINDIWDYEVVNANGKNYLAALNLEKSDNTKSYYLINPSYFAPYAYRIFAEVDTAHPWLTLVDTSYEVLHASVDSTLNTPTTAHIPPDWVVIKKMTGEVAPVPASKSLTSDFSFDAMRTPWRIALDYQWFKDERASEFLSKLRFLSDEWKKNGKIATHYDHAGNVINSIESPAMYGGVIGYFMVSDPALASEIYDTKLESLYNPDTFTWNYNLGYYDANWAWFGMALYNNLLPNLFVSSPSKI